MIQNIKLLNLIMKLKKANSNIKCCNKQSTYYNFFSYILEIELSKGHQSLF